MTKTLKDVALVLYDVPHSVACKICTKEKCIALKQHKGDECDLSCVDCIEKALRLAIKHGTPTMPDLNKKYENETTIIPYDENGKILPLMACCPSCGSTAIYDIERDIKHPYCPDCTQKINWEDQPLLSRGKKTFADDE